MGSSLTSERSTSVPQGAARKWSRTAFSSRSRTSQTSQTSLSCPVGTESQALHVCVLHRMLFKAEEVASVDSGQPYASQGVRKVPASGRRVIWRGRARVKNPHAFFYTFSSFFFLHPFFVVVIKSAPTLSVFGIQPDLSLHPSSCMYTYVPPLRTTCGENAHRWRSSHHITSDHMRVSRRSMREKQSYDNNNKSNKNAMVSVSDLDAAR